MRVCKLRWLEQLILAKKNKTGAERCENIFSWNQGNYVRSGDNISVGLSPQAVPHLFWASGNSNNNFVRPTIHSGVEQIIEPRCRKVVEHPYFTYTHTPVHLNGMSGTIDFLPLPLDCIFHYLLPSPSPPLNIPQFTLFLLSHLYWWSESGRYPSGALT